MTGWTPLAKSLLESAKKETPSAAAKAKVWSGVAASFAAGGAATGAVASVAPAAAGGGIAAVASAKMLVLGALLGSAVTLGVAATTFYLRVQPLPPLAPAVAMAPMALRVAHEGDPASSAMSPPPRTSDATSPVAPVASAEAPVAAVAPVALVAAPVAVRAVVKPTVATVARGARGAKIATGAAKQASTASVPADDGEDALMREASLVAEARSALRRGDPSAALSAIRAARKLPSHQLVPEEMALEAQALRGLGRGTEANGVGNALRDQYPDHALAR
jgi:hypothetical protein